MIAHLSPQAWPPISWGQSEKILSTPGQATPHTLSECSLFPATINPQRDGVPKDSTLPFLAGLLPGIEERFWLAWWVLVYSMDEIGRTLSWTV